MAEYPTTKPEDAFHAHLDECKQCREEIFNLCAVGMHLLQEAGKSLNADPMLNGLAQWNKVVRRLG